MRRDKEGFKRFFAYVAECGLAEPLREICLAHAVTLSDVYADVRGPTAHAARLECWWWLAAKVGKSGGEVARIFDRESSSIWFALAQLRKEAGGELDTQTHARMCAKAVASKASANQRKGGQAAVFRRASKKAGVL